MISFSKNGMPYPSILTKISGFLLAEASESELQILYGGKDGWPMIACIIEENGLMRYMAGRHQSGSSSLQVDFKSGDVVSFRHYLMSTGNIVGDHAHDGDRDALYKSISWLKDNGYGDEADEVHELVLKFDEPHLQMNRLRSMALVQAIACLLSFRRTPLDKEAQRH